jgi:hypothetical protein
MVGMRTTTMKTCRPIIALILLLTASARAQNNAGSTPQLSADQIVARCAQAMGGQEKINALKTMRFHPIFPDHGYKPLPFELKRPNLSRVLNSRLVFDGRRACFLKGSTGKTGPEMVDDEEWQDYEVEIGFYFPAFFEYRSEFLGEFTVEERGTYALDVTLPLGARLTYFIDKETFLPLKVTAVFTIRGTIFRPERIYSDYKEVAGILFPHGFTYSSPHGILKGVMESIDLNVPLPDELFAIPEPPKQEK